MGLQCAGGLLRPIRVCSAAWGSRHRNTRTKVPSKNLSYVPLRSRLADYRPETAGSKGVTMSPRKRAATPKSVAVRDKLLEALSEAAIPGTTFADGW